jgi:hypothetical protein
MSDNSINLINPLHAIFGLEIFETFSKLEVYSYGF